MTVVNVVVVKNGSASVQNLELSLDRMQKVIDGYIETIHISNGLILICDEEGKLKGKPFHNPAPFKHICGDFMIVADAGDDFNGLTKKQIAAVLSLFERREPHVQTET